MVLFAGSIASYASCDCWLIRVAPKARTGSLVCAPRRWRLVVGAWANHSIGALWICATNMTTAKLSHGADCSVRVEPQTVANQDSAVQRACRAALRLNVEGTATVHDWIVGSRFGSYRKDRFLRTYLRIVSRSLPQNICAPTKNVGTPNAPRRKASSAAAARTRSLDPQVSPETNRQRSRSLLPTRYRLSRRSAKYPF